MMSWVWVIRFPDAVSGTGGSLSNFHCYSHNLVTWRWDSFALYMVLYFATLCCVSSMRAVLSSLPSWVFLAHIAISGQLYLRPLLERPRCCHGRDVVMFVTIKLHLRPLLDKIGTGQDDVMFVTVKPRRLHQIVWSSDRPEWNTSRAQLRTTRGQPVKVKIQPNFDMLPSGWIATKITIMALQLRLSSQIEGEKV